MEQWFNSILYYENNGTFVWVRISDCDIYLTGRAVAFEHTGLLPAMNPDRFLSIALANTTKPAERFCTHLDDCFHAMRRREMNEKTNEVNQMCA